jgi:hypothetical protein
MNRLFPTFAFLTFVSLTILAGCASLQPGVERINAYAHFLKGGQKIDTGVVDYRYYDVKTGKFTYHFAPRECIRSSKSASEKKKTPCEAGEIDAGNMLREGDSLSISLLHAYICDFYEMANTPRELSRDFGIKSSEKIKLCHDHPENRAGTRGEIAIMASIFELGDQQIRFQADTIGDKSARMIYYNEDVRESGQSLNLSNLPMYGPVSYHGKQVYLGFFVIEIDGPEVRATGSIFRKLADLGSKAYPPSSPVLSALSKVGDAFKESQQDDSIADYKMVFDGAEGVSPRTAPLAAGLYVFTRIQDRSKDFEWSQYCLNPSTGKLYRRKDKATGVVCDETTGVICTTDTYFTIQVKRNEPALTQDVYQTFQEFSAQGAEAPGQSDALSESLDSLSQRVAATAAYDRARSAIASLSSPLSTARREAQEDLMNALCLGIEQEGSKAEDDSGRLSNSKVFYLLREAEAAGALKEPADAKDQIKTICDSRQQNWDGVNGFFMQPVQGSE